MGRELTPDEREGLGSLLFFGGLDTLKSALSFSISYLARNPEDYRRLVDDPGLIPSAMEELLRISGVTSLERGATHDFDYRGVPFRKGDRIVILTQILGVDDRLEWLDRYSRFNAGRPRSMGRGGPGQRGGPGAGGGQADPPPVDGGPEEPPLPRRGERLSAPSRRGESQPGER